MLNLGLLLFLFAAQDAPGEIADLLSKLKSDSVEERQAAADALAARGESVLAPLERRREDPDVELRARVLDVIARIRLTAFEKSLPEDLRKKHGDLARRILQGGESEQIQVLQALTGLNVAAGESREYRLGASRLKEDRGEYGGRAAPLVAEVARRAATPQVREAALYGIGWLHPSGDEDRAFRAGVARAYLEEKEEFVRLRAVELLWSSIGGKGRDALASRLEDASGLVRLKVVEFLGSLGDARVVEAAAEKCFSDPDPFVKAAYFKLALRRGREAAPVVVKALDGPLRMYACDAAVRLDAREAVPVLRGIVKGGDPYAYYAVRALGDFGDAESLPDLIALSRKPSSARLQEWFLTAYGLIGDRRALPEVQAALESKDGRTQGMALWAASVIDPAGTKERLKKILGDGPVKVRETDRAFALYALADMGEDVDARLVDLAGSRDWQVSSLSWVAPGAPPLTGNLFLLMLNRSRSPAVYERLRGAVPAEPYVEGPLREVLDRVFKAAKVPYTRDAAIPEGVWAQGVRALTRPNAACALARLATQQWEVGFVFEKEGVRVVPISEARKEFRVAEAARGK